MSKNNKFNPSLLQYQDEEKEVMNSTGRSLMDRVSLDRSETWIIRFIHPRFGPNKDLWYARIAQHWLNRKPIVCPVLTAPWLGGDKEAFCPVCDAATNLNGSRQKDVSDAGFKLKVQPRWLTYCLVWEKDGRRRELIEYPDCLKVYEFSHYRSTYDEMLGYLRGYRSAEWGIFDYNDGCDFSVTRGRNMRLDRLDKTPIFDEYNLDDATWQEAIKKVEAQIKEPNIKMPTEDQLHAFAEKAYEDAENGGAGGGGGRRGSRRSRSYRDGGDDSDYRDNRRDRGVDYEDHGDRRSRREDGDDGDRRSRRFNDDRGDAGERRSRREDDGTTREGARASRERDPEADRRERRSEAADEGGTSRRRERDPDDNQDGQAASRRRIAPGDDDPGTQRRTSRDSDAGERRVRREQPARRGPDAEDNVPFDDDSRAANAEGSEAAGEGDTASESGVPDSQGREEEELPQTQRAGRQPSTTARRAFGPTAGRARGGDAGDSSVDEDENLPEERRDQAPPVDDGEVGATPRQESNASRVSSRISSRVSQVARRGE